MNSVGIIFRNLKHILFLCYFRAVFQLPVTAWALSSSLTCSRINDAHHRAHPRSSRAVETAVVDWRTRTTGPSLTPPPALPPLPAPSSPRNSPPPQISLRLKCVRCLASSQTAPTGLHRQHQHQQANWLVWASPLSIIPSWASPSTLASSSAPRWPSSLWLVGWSVSHRSSGCPLASPV